MIIDHYWTYRPYGEKCFVIEGLDGELLIGDQLPSTEKEAVLLCRAANRARGFAREEVRKTLSVLSDLIKP